MIGLTIMRLQPLHNAHKMIVDAMIKETDKSYLLIGSANLKDERNPYSYDERYDMVKSVYKKEIEKAILTVIGINDINNRSLWVDYVLSNIPETPDVYYCGKGQDGELFKEKGMKVRSFERKLSDISATNIRNKMTRFDMSYKKDLPEPVYNIINSIKERK